MLFKKKLEDLLFFVCFSFSSSFALKERIEESDRLAMRNKVKEEQHLDKYRGLREDIGMKTYLHGPMDYAKKLKLRFRVGDLDLPEKRKRYTSSREEDVATNMWPCGTAIESRPHIVGA